MREFDEAKLEMERVHDLEEVLDALTNAIDEQSEYVIEGKRSAKDAAVVVGEAVKEATRKYFEIQTQMENGN